MFTVQKTLYEWWSEFLLCFVSSRKPNIFQTGQLLSENTLCTLEKFETKKI